MNTFGKSYINGRLRKNKTRRRKYKQYLKKNTRSMYKAGQSNPIPDSYRNALITYAKTNLT